MKHLLCTALLTVLPAVSATTFNVVAFPANGRTVAVKVGDKVTPLSLGEDKTVWSGDAEAKAGDTYCYAFIDSSGTAETEDFQRTLDSAWTSATLNEVYSRSLTVLPIPDLPQAYDAWPYGYVDALFNVSYVPTVHIFMPDVPFDEIYVRGTGKKRKPVQVVFVGQQKIYKREGVDFHLTGPSAIKYKKRQFTLTFRELLEGRKTLKFRTSNVDATFLRERIYTDIANSLGIPSQQGVHARTYVNGKFIGLYFMIDRIDVTWASAVVAGGKTPQTLIQTNSWDDMTETSGDLVYRGPNINKYVDHGYKVWHRGSNPAKNPMEDCISMMKMLGDVDLKKASESQLKGLEDVIDFELVYRHAALEFLALHWDGSWRVAGNYFLTKTNEGKWFISPTDYDYSFGSFIQEVNGGINASYKTWTAFTDARRVRGKTPLFDTIAHPVMNAKFEGILRNIVQRVFNSAAITPRLKALHDFIREDVKEEYERTKFPLKQGGWRRYPWTMEHFDRLYDKDMPKVQYFGIGIRSFTEKRANAVAAQLGFTLEGTTYVAPDPSTLYGGTKTDTTRVTLAPSFTPNVAIQEDTRVTLTPNAVVEEEVVVKDDDKTTSTSPQSAAVSLAPSVVIIGCIALASIA